MEVVRLAGGLANGDDVDGDATRGPDVVVVDAGGHDGDQHLVRLEGRDVDLFGLEGSARLAQAILAHHLRVHAARDLAERWQAANGNASGGRDHRSTILEASKSKCQGRTRLLLSSTTCNCSSPPSAPPRCRRPRWRTSSAFSAIPPALACYVSSTRPMRSPVPPSKKHFLFPSPPSPITSRRCVRPA